MKFFTEKRLAFLTALAAVFFFWRKRTGPAERAGDSAAERLPGWPDTDPPPEKSETDA